MTVKHFIFCIHEFWYYDVVVLCYRWLPVFQEKLEGFRVWIWSLSEWIY